MFIDDKNKLKYFKRPFFISVTNNRRKLCLCGFINTKIFIFNNKNKLINFKDLYSLKIKNITNIYFIDKLKNYLLIDTDNNYIYLYDKKLEKLIYKKNIHIDCLFFDKKRFLYYFSNLDFNLYSLDCESNFIVRKIQNFNKYQYINKISSIYYLKNYIYLLSKEKNELHKFKFNTNNLTHLNKVLVYGRGGNGFTRNPNDFLIFKNNIVVCDTDNYLIQIFDKNFKFIKQYFNKGIKKNHLDYALSFDNYKNTIYICDTNNDRIISYDIVNNATNIILKYFHSNNSLRRPSSVLSDSQDNIFVSDRSNNYIKIFDYNYKFISKSNKLKQPSKIKFYTKNKNNYLIVLERNDYSCARLTVFKIIYSDTVKLIKKSSKYLKFLRDPQDFTIIKNKIIFMDTLNRRLVLTSINAKLLSYINLNSVTNNKKILCKSIFVSKDFNIFICDFDNLIIYKFNKNFKFIKIIDYNLSKQKYKKLRAFYTDKSKQIFLTRHDKKISVKFKNKKITNIDYSKQTGFPVQNPTEINFFNNKFYIADKENDRIIITDKNLNFKNEIS